MLSIARTARNIVLLAVLCLAAGCAKPTATVDALSAPSASMPQNAGYLILPGMDGIKADDLYFVEYKNDLAAVLRGMGYQVTDDAAKAAAVVRLSWGGRETVLYTDPYGPSVGIGVGSGSGGYYDRDWDRWGGGSFFGLGVGFPVGGSAQASSRWRHTVVLEARSLPQDVSLWKVTLNTESGSDNLRGLMPALLQAAKPYIGKATSGPVTVPLEIP